MKNKVAVGQCYEKNDIIYEVMGHGKKYPHIYFLKEVITKEIFTAEAAELLKMRRPFNTEG
jgi:hypothetical protein